MVVYEHFSKRAEVFLVRRRRDIVTQMNVRRKIEIPLGASYDPSESRIQMLVALVRAGVYLLYILVLLPLIVSDRFADIVHAHYLLPQGLAGVMISRATKTPLILTAAGTDVNLLARRGLPRLLVQYVLFRSSSRVIAVSQDLLIKLRNLGCKNATYIPNCVEPVRNNFSRESLDAHHILFVGSLTTVKRPNVLVQAFRRVADQVPDARLTIVGIGPMRQVLEEMVSKLDLVDKVCLAGYLQGEELMRLYRKSTVFVLPSAMEGLSLALLEAMSFGTPIIVSASAHCGVIQDEVNGLIFRSDDVNDLARKIVWLFENPEKSVKLSVNAKLKLEQEYSLAMVAPKLEKVYSEVLSPPTPR